MITELPQEEWTRLTNERDTTLAKLTATEPLDEPAINAAMQRCYAHIGAEPAPIIWVDGPMSVLLAGHTFSRDQLRDQLWGQLGDQLRGQLWGQLGGQLGGQLWDQLGDQLRDQLRDQLGDQLRGQLWGQLGGQLRGSFISGWWFAWSWHYQALAGLPGIENIDQALLAKLEDTLIVNQCHHWLPLKGACIMSRQHTALHRDNRGDLHNPNGPAWEWADGTAIHALDGIRIPEWALTGSADKLLDLENAEQRRVAVKNYGWERAISDLELELIDANPDPHVGSLYRLPEKLRSEDCGTLLIVRNNSPHPGGHYETYGLMAGHGHQMAELTAVGAQAQLAGLTPEQFCNVGIRT